jgi:hypothetical protein
MAVFFPEMAIPDDTNITLSKTGGESWKVRLDHALWREMMTPGTNATVLWEP